MLQGVFRRAGARGLIYDFLLLSCGIRLLMFQPCFDRILICLILSLIYYTADNTSPVSYSKYVSKMKQELQAAYQLAQATSEKMNQKVRYHSLNVGDRVLIRNLGLKGKQKLEDRWSANPYVVESQLSSIPVYRLKPVDVNGPVRVMHRNHLLPLGQEVRLSPQVDLNPTPSLRALRRRKAKENRKTAESENSPFVVDAFSRDCNSSDSESEFGFYAEDVANIPSHVSDEIQSENPVYDVEGSESSDAQHVSEIPVIPCQSEISDIQLIADVVDTEVVDVMTEAHESTLQTTAPTDNETQPEVVPPEVRRSSRERRPNTRFTYDKLGVPYIQSVSSQLCGINVAATETLFLGVTPVHMLGGVILMPCVKYVTTYLYLFHVYKLPFN